MANTTMKDVLTKEAIRVYNGMIAVFPQFAQEEPINVSGLVPKFNGSYASNNSTVCFVLDGEVFVTPYTRNVIRMLESAGFSERSFYVPFSNWDYPKFEQYKWDLLREKAHLSYAQDFVEDCEAYCDAHHIGAISDTALRNCFEMPVSGVKVRRYNYEDCYYPLINSFCFDCTAVDRIGRFCTNNGRLVFVYRNGKTYVTKGYSIENELRSAGYVESGLFVPFSNGEVILDPVLKARWESIKK